MTTDPFLKNSKSNTQTTTNTTKNIKKIKKGKKIGLWTFILWCWIFILLFLFVWIGGLFYLAKNPQILLSWNNTNLEWPKQTLKIFWAIIFWILILLSFFLTVLNIIKLLTSKSSRWKYLIWTLIGTILLLFGILTWGFYYYLVKKIPSDYRIKNVSLITAQIETKDWSVPIENLRWFSFAPIYVDFYINSTKLDPAAIEIKFNCGNWQWPILRRRGIQKLKNLQLLWTCFFPRKWTYNITYTTTYMKNWKKLSKQFWPFPFKIISQINLNINWQNNNNFKLNDQFRNSINGQDIAIIGGNAPVKIITNASDVFNNYPTLLADWRIWWDFDWDGKIDTENKEKAYFIYKEKWTYTLYVNFPQIWQNFKVATLIINESDLPDCQLNIEPITNKKININLTLSDPTIQIRKIKWTIINPLDGSRVWIIKVISSNKLIGIVKNPWTYLLKLNLTLNNGKTLQCEKTFKTQKTFSKLPAIIYLSKWEEENYKLFKKIFIEKWKENTVVLPYKINFIKLLINLPTNENIANLILFDENQNPVNQPEKWKFTFTVKNDTTYILKIIYTNWSSDKFKIHFSPKPPKISGKLKIFPNSWFSPLKVILDASEIKLEDTDDEVIYYTWDFGDWQKFENVSQWKVPHEYKFDYENNNWIFYPRVKITTKKWLTLILTGKVIVKQPPRKVKITSDPASQIVRVWEKITFYLQTDWQIKSIHWNFGNWNTYSCQWRQCATISTSYDEPGTYTVKAIVDFYDYPSEIANLKVKVVNNE